MNSRFALLFAAALLSACATHPQLAYVVPDQPAGSWGFADKPGWATREFAVAAANPVAADAGYQILRAGGSAVDAAVAVQMVLSLVEPQSSGIGGGAFLLHYDGKEVEAYDGRETAPAAADGRLFMAADGKPMAFDDAVVGGRSVGVPGAVRMLELAHKEHGRLPWATLLQPAIALAEQGFKVSVRLNHQLEEDAHLRKDPVAAAYFYESDGTAVAAGTTLRNPALALVLRKIASSGSKALLEGDIAQAIVDKVRSHPTNPGRLTSADLAGYSARKRAPICHSHRAQAKGYRICGFPPPSSGAITIGEILGVLDHTPAAALPLVAAGPQARAAALPSVQWLHLYTESARLAFADRAQYIADPDFVDPPAGNWMSLLDPAYLAERAKLIDASSEGRSMKIARPGVPGLVRSSYAPMAAQVEHGTSHVSIVDRYGNALAMTTTVEAAFGARMMVNAGGGPGGFILNNELTDFSFTPVDADGRPIANAVQPGKRPRSSMAPTLVFEQPGGGFVMAAGSMGGPFIIHATAKIIYAVLHWDLDVQRAIDLPLFGSFNGPTILEENRFPPVVVNALRARGAQVREQPVISGAQAIQRTPTGYFGGADPRREGVVKGD